MKKKETDLIRKMIPNPEIFGDIGNHQIYIESRDEFAALALVAVWKLAGTINLEDTQIEGDVHAAYVIADKMIQERMLRQGGGKNGV
jgi:hypothetical protein